MSMNQSETGKADGFVFTGRHMALVMVLFFGTIISVNLTMAYFARSSWSGLVAENTYVASQEFNAKAALSRKIEASGVKGAITVAGSDIRYQLTAPKPEAALADRVLLTFRRPVGDHQDFEIALANSGNGLFTGSHAVLPGQWIVEAEAFRGNDIVMHEAVRVMVDGVK